MNLVYDDDYDNLVIASPIYVSNLTGPLMSSGSRLQVYYASKRFLGIKKSLRNKNGILILVGGGDGSPDKAIEYARWMFKKLDANFNEEEMIFSLNTDEVPAIQDDIAVQKVRQLTLKLNEFSQDK